MTIRTPFKDFQVVTGPDARALSRRAYGYDVFRRGAPFEAVALLVDAAGHVVSPVNQQGLEEYRRKGWVIP